MQEKKRLLNGTKLICPRCKKEHSVEAYARLGEAEEFKSETVPISKCPSCKWIFALALPEDFQNKLMELLSLSRSVAEKESQVK